MSQRFQIITQSQLSVFLVGFGKWFLIGLGIIGLMKFSEITMPPPDRIEDAFTIRLPEDARQFGWHSENGWTLARFTIDIEGLESMRQSARSDTYGCFSEIFMANYMPEFSRNDAVIWWHPDEVKNFESISCSGYDMNGAYLIYDILIDYDVSGEATVYIEENSVD